jgi:hypothetical protein
MRIPPEAILARPVVDLVVEHLGPLHSDQGNTDTGDLIQVAFWAGGIVLESLVVLDETVPSLTGDRWVGSLLARS